MRASLVNPIMNPQRVVEKVKLKVLEIFKDQIGDKYD